MGGKGCGTSCVSNVRAFANAIPDLQLRAKLIHAGGAGSSTADGFSTGSPIALVCRASVLAT